MPENYKTETGKSLKDSNIYDFVVDTNGNKNLGEINSDIEEKTNGIVKAAPIRLQVGNYNFGYLHLTGVHLEEMNNKGYEDSISYIKKILDNVNKIYSRADTGNLNRFILCSEGKPGKSKDFMPIDLELEKGTDNYYRIITAYPKSGKNIEGILIFDDSTHSSSVTATDSLVRLADDKSGVSYHGANAKISNPSVENISQSAQNDKEIFAETPTQNKFEVGEFTHTKTGEKIPSAKLNDKVERDEYLKLNTLAKKHGGSYSKFAKRFLFDTAEKRDAFVKESVGENSNDGMKFSGKGDLKKMFSDAEIISDDKLTSQQKKLVEFGENEGVKIVWIKAHKDLQGAMESGKIYINYNAPRKLDRKKAENKLGGR